MVDEQIVSILGHLHWSICKRLSTMLCHPIWQGDISAVRYVLQITTMHRVPGHILPIAPLPPLPERSDLGPRPEIKRVCDMLEMIVKEGDPKDGPQHREQILFHLQDKDVQTVIEALDQMEIYGKKVFNRCDSYLAAYKSSLERGNEEAFPPGGLATLKQWKKAYVLCMRRDWIVAVRHWKGEVPGPRNEEKAYDITHGDPYPAHLDCEELGVTDAHRELLQGTI
ncbi:hypothetical protein VTK56DRAFT_7612 [Thermocarpiscus australiensis]